MAEVESAQERPGEPDGFERLWTPHRMLYIGGQDKPATGEPEDCPFCTIPAREDRDGLIVHRDELAYVVLNLYPYSPGHLLVCPYRHVAGYPELTPEETVAVATLTQQAMRVVREASAPHGFNLGINQGAVAGAGIAAHLHQHVVPRWSGDANFLPVVGQTKALPQLLDQTWQVLSEAWVRVGGSSTGSGPSTGSGNERPSTGSGNERPSTSSGHDGGPSTGSGHDVGDAGGGG